MREVELNAANHQSIFRRLLFSSHRPGIFPVTSEALLMARAGTGGATFPGPAAYLGTANYFLDLAIIIASYFCITEAALLLPAINVVATPLWPPTGVALSLILLRGNRIWPAIATASFSAGFISSSSMTLLETAFIAVATSVAALSGAWLINRWSCGRKTFASAITVGNLGSWQRTLGLGVRHRPRAMRGSYPQPTTA